MCSSDLKCTSSRSGTEVTYVNAESLRMLSSVDALRAHLLSFRVSVFRKEMQRTASSAEGLKLVRRRAKGRGLRAAGEGEENNVYGYTEG